MWMALGMVSLLLCAQLTWSLALTALPSARLARVAITSLAFILLLVPEPVWYTSSGKCVISAASSSSWRQAAAMASPCAAVSCPSATLARAAASLASSSARMKPSGRRWPLTGKFCTARWVCAP
ncbi:hypothetical protein D3C78_1382550 [compost metagenome]